MNIDQIFQELNIRGELVSLDLGTLVFNQGLCNQSITPCFVMAKNRRFVNASLWIENLKFAIPDDQYNRVVNPISIGVKRECAQNCVQTSGFCQGVPNCS